MKWTEEEISSLINFYSNYSKEYIMNKIPNRTWNSIVLMAGKLHLKFDSKYRRNSSLEILLNESHVSYYWIGFLMADGHFANRKRLKIWASIKDKIQIDSLANYLNCSSVTESVITNNKLNKKYKIIGFTAQNPNVIQQICDRFDIQSNKTENPPKTKVFKKIHDDLLLSLIIGFIDGDGSISIGKNRKTPSLTIKNHKSWLNNLTFFQKTHIFRFTNISHVFEKYYS